MILILDDNVNLATNTLDPSMTLLAIIDAAFSCREVACVLNGESSSHAWNQRLEKPSSGKNEPFI